MKYGILIHEAQDDVGVAVLDLQAGSEIGAATLEGESLGSVTLADDVPLGHKVAMKAMAAGQDVTEYSRTIGSAKEDIVRGAHVHVHNIQTKRW